MKEKHIKTSVNNNKHLPMQRSVEKVKKKC